MRRATVLAATIAALITPTSAATHPYATLQTSLKPEQLGGETTIGFGFHIKDTTHGVPPPLTGFELSYPIHLGFALSELGLATCTTTTLELHGPRGCPANSIMGYGIAVAEVAIDPEVIGEKGYLTVVRSKDENNHLALLFYAEAYTPVLDELVFKGAIQPANPPFGGRVTAKIPTLEAFAYGPDLSVIRFSSTIGPQGLTYNERRHGQFVPYTPRGIALPNHCPHQGFVFSAHFTFQDGTQAHATSTVGCPTHKPHK